MSGERGRPAYRSPLTAYLALALTACGLTPLTNRIAVGEEAFVIGVGEGADSLTDLYAAPAGGGPFVRLTYNRTEERAPRLSPDGKRVAYLRRAPGSPAWSLVIHDLLSSAEHAAPLPAGAAEPERLGWSSDGRTVIVSAQGFYESGVPPARVALSRVSEGLARADSITGVLVGAPVFGTVRDCRDGNPCILTAAGELTLLGDGVRGVVRWGGDSVGYFRSTEFEVRPLAGGRVRRPLWEALPAHLRDITYHPGQLTTRSGVSGRR